MNKFKSYIKLLRVKHYIKNLLIFFPIFFAGKIFDINLLINSIIGFLIYSLTASIVYIINDLKDIDNDRKHEIKKNRPLASGSVSKNEAYVILSLLIIFIILLNNLFIKNTTGYIYLGLYLFINILYSFKLKNVPIIDILILSLGFLIRVMYGGAIINIDISNWLYLTVLSISFYMSMGKRRNEIKKIGTASRSVLKKYTYEFLDKGMSSFLSMALVFFSLWSMELNNKYILIIIPLIFSLCLRYSYDIENSESFGDPTDVILKDYVLLIFGGLTILAMFLILYIISIGV